VVLSPTVREHLQIDACPRRFVICHPEITQLTFYVFKAFFQEWKLLFKSCIRNCLFRPANNFEMSALSDFCSVYGVSQPLVEL
jgi:hypothetical protein